jgi:hypothetical protein
MTTDERPRARTWGWRETAAALAVAAAIAALGGAAIYAATAGGPHSFGAPHRAAGPGFGMPGGAVQHDGHSAPVDLNPPSLHGEYVVSDGAGRYTTVVTQTGAVTAISPTSITVRSADGFTQTYVIPSTAGNAGAPFAVDDQVVVRATRTGSTVTVTNIGKPPPGN